MSWWYAVNQEKSGPVELSALHALFDEKKIDRDTLIWTKGMADWQPLGTVQEVVQVITHSDAPANATPPQLSAQPPAQAPAMTSVPADASPSQAAPVQPTPIYADGGFAATPRPPQAPKETSPKKVLLYVLLFCVLVLSIAYAFMTGALDSIPGVNPPPVATTPPAPKPSSPPQAGKPAQKAPVNTFAWSNPVTKIQADIDLAWTYHADGKPGEIDNFSFKEKGGTTALFVGYELSAGRTLESFAADLKKEVADQFKFSSNTQTMTFPADMPAGTRGLQIQATNNKDNKKHIYEFYFVSIGKSFWMIIGDREESTSTESRLLLDILRLKVLKTLK